MITFSLLASSAYAGKDAKLVEEKESKRQEILGKLGDKVEDLKKYVEDQIESASISFDLDAIDVKEPEFLAKAGYGYEDEPSYADGMYTRTDSYQIRLGTNLLEIFQDATFGDLGVNPYIEARFGAHFIRQHEAEKGYRRAFSLIKKPLFLTDMPLTADRALKKMEKDGYFSLPMSIDYGIRLNLPISAGNIQPKLGSFYRLGKNEFALNIFRENENLFNVKLIGIKRSGRGVHFRVDLDIDGIVGDQFYEDKILDEILGKNLFSWSLLNKDQGDLVVIDYTFDFSKAGAREAYNSLIKSILTRDTIRKFINPFGGIEDIKEASANISEPVNQVAAISNSGVYNNFAAHFDFESKPSSLSIGNKMAEFELDKHYTKNEISYTDQSGETKYAISSSHSYKRETQFLWKLFESSRRRNASLIVSTDAEGNVTEELTDYRVTDEMRDKISRKDEQIDAKEFILGNIGTRYGNQIEDELDDLITSSPQKNFKARVEMIFDQDAISYFRNADRKDIKKSFKNYVLEQNQDRPFLQRNFNKFMYMISGSYGKVASVLDDGLGQVHEVKTTSSKGGANHKRAAGFTRKQLKEEVEDYVLLERRGVFRDYGLGYIMSVLDAETQSLNELESVSYAKVTVTSKEVEKTFVLGKYPESSSLFGILEYVYSVLGGKSFDITRIRDANLRDRLQR